MDGRIIEAISRGVATEARIEMGLGTDGEVPVGIYEEAYRDAFGAEVREAVEYHHDRAFEIAVEQEEEWIRLDSTRRP